MTMPAAPRIWRASMWQTVIFEREGRVLKTHRGVRTEFNRIMKGERPC